MTAEPSASPPTVINTEDFPTATDIPSESADSWSQIQVKCLNKECIWLVINKNYCF
jgi:hypothetical protein